MPGTAADTAASLAATIGGLSIFDFQPHAALSLQLPQASLSSVAAAPSAAPSLTAPR